MPIRLQLALQGGGAKMYALIAALEVIDESVKKGDIEITRIAGTSAGAIVGALYAAGVEPATMRAEFGKAGLLPKVPRKAMAITRALLGFPIVKDEQLRSTIEKLLRGSKTGPPVMMEGLGKPCFIIASDVCNRSEVVYHNKSPERAVDCLMRSSGIPFFFVSHSGQQIIVDGGLCNNLPSNVLSSGIKGYGEIIAVSFSEYTRNVPTNAIAFAKTLLDTAIDAGVARAKHGSNVFLIELDPYGVGTFDFKQGQLYLDSDSAPYRDARSRTEKVLKEIIRPGRVVGGALWTSADPTMMNDLWRIYESQEAPRKFRYLRRSLCAIAHSLLNPEAEDINSIAAQILVKEGGSPGNVVCEVNSLGQKVAFVPVPLKLASGGGIDTYGLLICFTPPLPAGGNTVYTLTIEYGLKRAFPGLDSTSRTDDLVSKAIRADGLIPLMELILYIPKALNERLVLSPKTEPSFVALNKESGARYPGYAAFDFHRWTARDVDPEKNIGILLQLH